MTQKTAPFASQGRVLTPHERTRISIRLDEFPDSSELGVWIEFDDQLLVIPLEGARWMADALQTLVEAADEIASVLDDQP